MCGHLDPQASMFSYFAPEARVPAAHPLRSIKGYADTVLKSLSRDMDELYAAIGRPSTAFDCSSLRLFEACSYQPAPKDLPSSQVQHRAQTARSWHSPAGILPGHADNQLLDVVVYLRSANLSTCL